MHVSAVATAGWSRICGRFFQDHGIASEQMIYLREFFSEGKRSLYEYQDIYTTVFAALHDVWFNTEPELIVGYR
jgi:hypothetical protein